nr:bifunctional ornithine acetyltransferase/N-acetylglutamate synthase [Sporanaerobium hydrogeniformans]
MRYGRSIYSNVVKASSVLWNKEILKAGGKVRAIVANSGNANAATGEQGYQDTAEMAAITAKVFNIQKEEVLVCSTGVIGVNLPMNVITKGIPQVAATVSDTGEGAKNASDAILTTDTFSKTIAVQEEVEGVTFTIGGMGKGSGMIHPNMATMLGFITTDVNITAEMLQKALQKAINTTFNMITVDGDTSTNDTVLVIANGEAGNKLIAEEGEAFDKFFNALYEVCKYIAISIVKDGEGATKLLEVTIKGAADFEAGKMLAKSILTSSLVKTAFFGADANWGRIFAAMGYAGVAFDPNQVDIAIESNGGFVSLLKQGLPVKFSEEKAKKVLEESEIKVLIQMSEGEAEVTAWGCDLSYDYVKINGDYRS